MRRLGDNFSTLTAPFVIVLTFGQTLGSLLDLECPWPNLLREWMQMLDIFNINLELARYEHTCPLVAPPDCDTSAYVLTGRSALGTIPPRTR